MDLTLEGGCTATDWLLKQSPELTAIFALSDMLAIGALHHAYRCGISVPGALSLVGFDGVALGRYVRPALTSIGQPVRELGALAAIYLLQRIRGGRQGAACRLLLRPNLTVRDSTGPAPP